MLLRKTRRRTFSGSLAGVWSPQSVTKAAAAQAPAPPREAVQLVLVTNIGGGICYAEKHQEKDL